MRENYFISLWHLNSISMSTSPLPHIISVVALFSPILSKKKSSLNWASLNTYLWTSSSAIQKILCLVFGLFLRPFVSEFNYISDFWNNVTDITGNGLQNITANLSILLRILELLAYKMVAYIDRSTLTGFPLTCKAVFHFHTLLFIILQWILPSPFQK